MEKELRDRWIEALESGKYKQGQRYLCIGDEYCCLGVLCEITGYLEDPFGEGRRKQVKGPINTSALPVELMEEFGIDGRQHDDLTDMNDGRGTPQRNFREIAEWIREKL